MNELKKADEIVSWKRVIEFPQYEVSNTGLVRKGAKIKKCRINSHGYPSAVLYENGRKKNVPVHRLVAIAFISNPDNLPQVNHKDENKQNNNVKNLEWCDAKYNNNYSNAAGRAFDYKSIPVVMLTFDGAVHGTFPGSASASRQTGISQGNINEVCTGKRASAGGYVFKYASDLIQELQAQLSASQRREKAAVEDIWNASMSAPCAVCANGFANTGAPCTVYPCKFEWRGPQTEKGAVDGN